MCFPTLSCSVPQYIAHTHTSHTLNTHRHTHSTHMNTNITHNTHEHTHITHSIHMNTYHTHSTHMNTHISHTLNTHEHTHTLSQQPLKIMMPIMTSLHLTCFRDWGTIIMPDKTAPNKYFLFFYG